MKATIEFSLPEDEHDFKCACKATDIAFVLRDIDHDMRNLLKHVEMDSQTRVWLEGWRRDINEALEGIEP